VTSNQKPQWNIACKRNNNCQDSGCEFVHDYQRFRLAAIIVELPLVYEPKKKRKFE
jgi:hypothetical protein